MKSRPLTVAKIAHPAPTRRTALAWLTGATGFINGLAPMAADAAPATWQRILDHARGQTVYFHAWGGAATVNRYIQWAGEQVRQRFGVTVVHVKIQDAADVVRQVRNQRGEAKPHGSIDLVWINGANFLTMKREGLLFGPFAEQLPSYAYVDTQGQPTTRLDFAEPVDGMEAPWGMAQLTFMADANRVAQPPQDLAAWLAFATAHPGRTSYPRPPDFHGMTFLKQLLLDLTPESDRPPFYKELTVDALARLTRPLWTTLDGLQPQLWRQGKQFPNSAAAQRQMMSDGELLLAMSFNPNEVPNEIAAQRLAKSTISFQFKGGTIGNTHFLAIPITAQAKAAAQVLSNFLLSPEAQGRKADIAIWGDPTVLDLRRLSAADQAFFKSKPHLGQLQARAPALPEPHGSWVQPIQEEWARRYGA